MSATDIRTDYSMTAGEALPIAVRAAGCRIETEDGTSYLDACGGAMVMLLGHGHPRVVEALKRQSEVLNFTYRFSFRNEPMLELAERVRRVAPGDLEWCFFNSSGSEANESAMHLAVLYWELCGKPAKLDFLSRVTSYHGSTLGALSLSGSRWRAPFEPLLHKYAAVPNSLTAEEGAAELEAAILSRGADHIAAFILEPVTGSSGAAVELPPGYLQAVRDVCDRYDILLIADEIITAFGRTGRWFAVEHDGVAAGHRHLRQGHRRRRHPALGDGRDAHGARGRRELADRVLVRPHVLRISAGLRGRLRRDRHHRGRGAGGRRRRARATGSGPSSSGWPRPTR